MTRAGDSQADVSGRNWRLREVGLDFRAHVRLGRGGLKRLGPIPARMQHVPQWLEVRDEHGYHFDGLTPDSPSEIHAQRLRKSGELNAVNQDNR